MVRLDDKSIVSGKHAMETRSVSIASGGSGTTLVRSSLNARGHGCRLLFSHDWTLRSAGRGEGGRARTASAIGIAVSGVRGPAGKIISVTSGSHSRKSSVARARSVLFPISSFRLGLWAASLDLRVWCALICSM